MGKRASDRRVGSSGFAIRSSAAITNLLRRVPSRSSALATPTAVRPPTVTERDARAVGRHETVLDGGTDPFRRPVATAVTGSWSRVHLDCAARRRKLSYRA